MADFRIIVITSPDHVYDEANKISLLLDAGVDYVHIRKPGWSLRDVRNLIEDIPYKLRSRLRLHGHFGLTAEMNLGGVHLNRRNPVAPRTVRSVTRSCHTLQEIGNADGFEYQTLSPVFDSISKQGYSSCFDINALSEEIAGKNVIALGGITPEHFLLLREKGFIGAALLGYIWNDDFSSSLEKLTVAIKNIRNNTGPGPE